MLTKAETSQKYKTISPHESNMDHFLCVHVFQVQLIGGFFLKAANLFTKDIAANIKLYYTRVLEKGNTFSSFEKLNKIHFPIFWRYGKYVFCIYFISWPSYRPLYGSSQHFVFVLRMIQYDV